MNAITLTKSEKASGQETKKPQGWPEVWRVPRLRDEAVGLVFGALSLPAGRQVWYFLCRGSLESTEKPQQGFALTFIADKGKKK